MLKEKKKIIEDVMDKEPYKVAKDILEKFAPDSLPHKVQTVSSVAITWTYVAFDFQLLT